MFNQEEANNNDNDPKEALTNYIMYGSMKKRKREGDV